MWWIRLEIEISWSVSRKHANEFHFLELLMNEGAKRFMPIDGTSTV